MASTIRCCQPGCGWKKTGINKQEATDRFTAHWQTDHAGLPAPTLRYDKISRSTLVHEPVHNAPEAALAASPPPGRSRGQVIYWQRMTPEQRSAEMTHRSQVKMKNQLARLSDHHAPEREPSVRFCPNCGHNLMIYGTALKVAHKLSNH